MRSETILAPFMGAVLLVTIMIIATPASSISLDLKKFSPDDATESTEDNTKETNVDALTTYETNPSTAGENALNTTNSDRTSLETRGRTGRMMDLDGLMGDIESSRKKKMENVSGNRQSRILNEDIDISTLMGASSKKKKNKNKMSIQGFIPIVTMNHKNHNNDDSETDNDEDSGEQQVGSSPEASASSPSISANNDKQQQQQQQQQDYLNQLAQYQLEQAGYGQQTSTGHASTGVQPLYQQNADHSQMKAKSLLSGSSNTRKLLNPSALLGSLVGGGGSTRQPNAYGQNLMSSLVPQMNNHYQQLEAQQSSIYDSNQMESDCVCVPFYMCKAGRLTEASLSKLQLSHLEQRQQRGYQQQQQQMLPTSTLSPQISASNQQELLNEAIYNQLRQSIDSGKYGPSSDSSNQAQPQQQQQQQQSQDDNSYTLVDERSNQNKYTSENLGGSDLHEQANNQQQNSTQKLERGESLGRSLLKGIGKRQGGNYCGMLRTCCKLPSSLLQPVANHIDSIVGPPVNPIQVVQSQQQQQPFAYPGYLQAYPQHQQQLQQPPTQLLYPKRRPSIPQQQQQQQQQHVNSYSSHQQQPLPLPSNPAISHYQAPQIQLLRPNSIHSSQASGRGENHPQSMASFNHHSIGPQLMQHNQQNHQINKLPNRPGILEGRCGLRQSSGISGRVQNLQYHDNSAEFGEFPSQAAILKRMGPTDSLYACAATLISHQWLATAAHCIRKFLKDELKVRLGDWDVHREDEFYPHIEKSIKDIVIHPEFTPGTLLNDIALIRLESPIDPQLPHISPACLPSLDETFTGQRCWVTGWGKDAFGQRGTFQSVLKKVDLPVLGHNECEQSLKQTKLGPYYRLHPGFICAGGERGKDACEGDGGSGLYCIQADGLIKAAGLVSWGIGCGQQNVPGVYVNMGKYVPWIEEIISIDEDLYGGSSGYASNSLISERSNTNGTTTTYNNSTTTTTTATNPNQIIKTTIDNSNRNSSSITN